MSDLDVRPVGKVGRITLRRPDALNALSWAMVRDMQRALDAWAIDDAIEAVMVDAVGEKAFCAGGDIQDLYRAGAQGDYDLGRRFWAEEYRLNATIARFPKPYIAIMHGFTLGGGIGISAHGAHRVVTESSQIGLPECSLGLIPDVGSTWLLSRAPGCLGEWLGMTGERMGPAEAIYAGFADSFVPGNRIEALKAKIEEGVGPGVIGDFAEVLPENRLFAIEAEIDAIFGLEQASEIETRLSLLEAPWARRSAKALARNCPLAVATALRAIRDARGFKSLDQALAREYRFVYRAMEAGDFLEGIRAAVIDKDRQPRWKNKSLADIRLEVIEEMLGDLGEAELPQPII